MIRISLLIKYSCAISNVGNFEPANTADTSRSFINFSSPESFRTYVFTYCGLDTKEEEVGSM
jgi:hypothetical protein